jgi:hypothetical protein
LNKAFYEREKDEITNQEESGQAALWALRQNQEPDKDRML